MTAVAVIGLGAMGSRIARRLIDAGHDVSVWNRSPEKVTPLIERGATALESPADAARECEAVITMVADADALRAVTEGPSGIAAGLDGDATLIEMSTVGPAAIAHLRSVLPDEAKLLDAPVLGSLSEVEASSLRIFVGGPPDLYQRWQSLLSVLGSPIHVGPLGSGAAAKLVANLTLVGTLALLGEALALADGLGIDRAITYEVLAGTPLGAQAERRRPAIETDEYERRFSLSLARKDATLIAEAARQAGIDLRLIPAAKSWFDEADEAGWGERDYSAVLSYILRGG